MYKSLKKIPYKLEILILIIIPFISIIEYAHMAILSNRGGLSNFPSWGFILFILYEPLKVAVVILAIFRFVYVKHVKKLNKYFNTAILSIPIYIGSLILPFFFLPPGAVFFLKGYEQWVSKNVDFKVIQTWLLSEEADKYIGNTYAGNLPDDLPDFVINFEPKSIYFKAEESEKGKSIIFEWGGVFGHWGIVISSPTTKTKQQGIIEEPGSSNVEIRHPIIPGVYIFYDG
jgi:hypothetical protein